MTPANLLPDFFTIPSDRFVIRPMLRGDASPSLSPWIEDENAAAMLNTPRRSWTVAQQEEYFAKHEGPSRRRILGIFPKDAKDPIGLFILKLNPKHAVVVVSHLIGDTAWRGSNTSSEASRALYGYLFNTLGYAKAKCNVNPGNKSMLWLLYSFAWRKEARLSKHLRLAASGERSDLLVFGLLADDWRARQEALRLASADQARQKTGAA
ncbi:MAG: GNAT family N-acetyltransferase [Parvibaculaceae bacterium]